MLKIRLIIIITLLFTSCNTIVENNSKNESIDSTTIVDSLNQTKPYTSNSSNNNKKLNVKLNISYVGTIGEYPIEMVIEINPSKNTVYGSYKYINIKKEHSINLTGKIENNSIFMTEDVYKNQERGETGSFDLKFVDLSQITGTWQNPEKTKSLEVTLKSLEKFDHKPLNFVFKAELKKSLVEKYEGSEEKGEFDALQKLDIYHNNKLIQSISEFLPMYDGDKSERKIILDTEHFFFIELEDFNFDGYFDLKLYEDYPFGHKPDGGYLYFLYNVNTNQFEENKELNYMSGVSSDGFRKMINSGTADGSGNESYTDYIWQGNNLKMIKRTEYFEDRREPEITEYP